MLTIAGGIIIAVFVLAALPFLLQAAAVVIVIGIVGFIFVFCLGHWPDVTGALFFCSIPIGMWLLKHKQNRDAERQEPTYAERQRAITRAKWYVDHGLDPVSHKPFPKDHPAMIAWREKCDREGRELLLRLRRERESGAAAQG